MYRLRSKQHNYTFFALCYTLCLFLALSFCLTFVKAQDKFVIAADTYWSNNQSSTEKMTQIDDYYQLASGEDLSWFLRNSGASKAILYCDIDMSKHVWDGPTVLSDKEIYGKGHIISGLKYKGSNNGLITSSSGGDFTFKNMSLHIEATTTVDGSTGGFVGSKTSGSLTLDSCSVYGTISNSNNCSYRYVGGLVGKCNSLTATRCFNYATISGSVSSYSIGGIVGTTSASTTFTLCANTASLSGTAKYMGGLAGYAKNLTLYNARCFNSGAITNNSTSGYAGGLIGYASNPSNTTLSYVYNTGNIKSQSTGGGLVGYTSKNLTISNVYNTAIVDVPQGEAQSRDLFSNKIVNTTASFKGYTYYQNYTGKVSASIVQNGGETHSDSDYFYDIKASMSVSEPIITDVSFIGNGKYTKSGSYLYSVNPHSSTTTTKPKFSITGSYVSNGTTLCTFSQYNFSSSSSTFSTSTKVYSIILEVANYSYWYAGNGYPFRYAIFGYNISDLPNQHYSSYKELSDARLIGIHVSISGNNITLTPYLSISYAMYNNGYYGGSKQDEWVTTDVCGTYSYTYTSSNSQNISYVSESTIKSATFSGSYFSTDSQINGSLPYFPEMYW